MKFCKKCGNELKPEDQFCGKCGAPVNKQNTKNEKANKKKVWIAGIAIVVVCAVIAGIGVGVVKPYCEKLSVYNEAESLMKKREYAKASKKFAMLEDFKNAKSKQLECQYSIAEEYYKDKKFEEAKEIYEQLGKYSDSAECVTKCQYEIAKDLYQNKKYEHAIEAFHEIETYKDAKEQIQHCYYQMGEEAYQESDYETAMTYLEKAPDVEEAKTLYEMLEWRVAYTELLENREGFFYYDEDRTSTDAMEFEEHALAISLAYIDEDNIPELIVYRDDGNHGDGCWIYTMIDGEAQKVVCEDEDYKETFGSWGAIQVFPKKSLICGSYVGMGNFSDDYYELKDGKLEPVVKLLGVDLDLEEMEPGVAKYYVNDKKVSKAKYEKEQNKLYEEYGSDYKWVGNAMAWNEEAPTVLLRDCDYSVETMMDCAIDAFCLDVQKYSENIVEEENDVFEETAEEEAYLELLKGKIQFEFAEGQKEIFEESTKYKIKDLDYDGISEMIVQGDTAFFLFTYDMEQKDIKLVQVESLDYGDISCEL